MPQATAHSMSISLMILTFFVGFAIAALIFWPMLRRAHQHPAARLRGSAFRPARKHVPLRIAAESGGATEFSLASKRKTEEALAAELGELPEIPSGLFDKHHAKQFARARARIDRLRAQVNELSS